MESENPTTSDSEMLDWLCWRFAVDAERFFPPDETAQECVEQFDYEDGSLEKAEAVGWEKGQHSRAWTEAVEFFHDLEMRGHDPKERAEREIERSREDDLDLPEIDWSWYEASGRVGEEEEEKNDDGT